MKSFTVVLLVFAYFGAAGALYQHNQSASLKSYSQGCHDSLNDLYTRLGIKDVDQDSLNEHCDRLIKKYSGQK